MRAKELALAYLVLGKIHGAILDGLIQYSEILACPHFCALLVHLYETSTAPSNYFVVVYDIRAAMLKKSVAPAIVITHLQPTLDAIHRKQRKRRSALSGEP